MPRHRTNRINKLVENRAYGGLGPALERLLAAQDSDPDHVGVVIAETIGLLRTAPDNDLCHECGGTGLASGQHSLLRKLSNTAKPIHIFSQPPGAAPADHRWVCSQCPGRKQYRKSTNDLRRHLKTHHGASTGDLALIFSPLNERKLYEHFGPCTWEQALLNDWQVSPWKDSRNALTEDDSSVLEQLEQGSMHFSEPVHIDPALTMLSSDADFYPVTADVQGGAGFPSEHMMAGAIEEDPMASSIISSVGSQFDGGVPVLPVSAPRSELTYSSYADNYAVGSSAPSQFDLDDICNTRNWASINTMTDPLTMRFVGLAYNTHNRTGNGDETTMDDSGDCLTMKTSAIATHHRGPRF